jgi:hypothetical protein
MNNFNYEFEIYLPDDETPMYICNDSPKLTKDFVEFLEEWDIDITECVYKVNKITN